MHDRLVRKDFASVANQNPAQSSATSLATNARREKRCLALNACPAPNL
jgi:hypothetical protein